MTTGSSISAAIRDAKAHGKDKDSPAIVAYITAGFPRRETFVTLLNTVADAADVVEIGVPFSDPMADGTTIQRSGKVALDQGVSLKWILSTLAGVQPRPRAPLLLMSYLNPLLAYGLDRLPQAAAEAGISGFIVPDLPYEECDDLRRALEARGIALVQFVTPVTPIERVQMLAANTSGFLYGVTMTGTTGKNVAVPQEVLDYFASVQRMSAAPVCAGFGIRSRDQVARMAPYVDGVIVGSALVEVIERGEDPAAFLNSLRG